MAEFLYYDTPEVCAYFVFLRVICYSVGSMHLGSCADWDWSWLKCCSYSVSLAESYRACNVAISLLRNTGFSLEGRRRPGWQSRTNLLNPLFANVAISLWFWFKLYSRMQRNRNNPSVPRVLFASLSVKRRFFHVALLFSLYMRWDGQNIYNWNKISTFYISLACHLCCLGYANCEISWTCYECMSVW